MKIAYIHNCLWPSKEPSVNFVTFNAVGFNKSGYDFTLYVKNNSIESTEDVLKKTFNVGETLNLQRIDSFRFIKNHFYFYKVYRILKRSQFDVLITRHSSFLPYLVWLKNYFYRKGKDVKILFEPHDFYYDLSLRSDLNEGQVKRKWKNQRYERKYLPSMDGMIYLQPNLKKYYEKYLSLPGVTAYTGVVRAYENKLTPDKNQLIYIGSISGEKYSGIHTLIKAMEHLPEEMELTVIGGRNNKEIERLYREINPELKNRITVTGWIGHSEIKEIALTRGRMSVILFHQDFFADNFAYPLKFCDYLSFGLPVICSFSNNNKLIQENIHGVFFENDNSVDLAEKIRFLWSDEERLNSMSRQVHRLAEERLWENRATVIVEFLKTL